MIMVTAMLLITTTDATVEIVLAVLVKSLTIAIENRVSLVILTSSLLDRYSQLRG